MRVYMASMFKRRAELASYIPLLEAAGHTCTSRWLVEDHEMSYDTEADRFAREDCADVVAAHAMINFTEVMPYTDMLVGRGGRHVEFGLAVAWETPICIVGPRENVFHHLSWVVQVDDIHQAIKWLETIQ